MMTHRVVRVACLPALLLLLLALAVAARAQSSPPSSALTSLADAERAFAKMSVEKGRRDAFLANFADDAVFLAPEPVNARQVILKWPAAAPFRLDWEPHFGDISAAGDLGYTTGPFVRTSPSGDGKVVGTGWYFTLWKKEADGRWKVAVDAGINSPPSGPLRPVTFVAASKDPVASVNRASDVSLRAADVTLCQALASGGMTAGFSSAATEQTRIYREGIAPLAGTAAIRKQFGDASARMTCEPTTQVTSSSDDLGYAVGKYALAGGEGGYYLRVWRREGTAWKLAFDLLVPRT